MKYGICNIGIAPLRAESSHRSEMVTQLLYGDHFQILETNSRWSLIKNSFDNYQGWIDTKQFLRIPEAEFLKLEQEELKLSADLVDYVTDPKEQLVSICLGSTVSASVYMNHNFEGKSISGKQPKEHLISTALLYLNSPYLWGGKTPFGIDCSGLAQMVYKLNGYRLMRDARDQAGQGEALSFIEESQAGDLAFFDNDEGVITHVGIIMDDNYIIHAHGTVRIDRLDHTGIFNSDLKKHTHKLRIIKRII